MVPRLYIPQPLHAGQRLEPDAEMRHYLLRTLRLPLGARLTLFNGIDQGEWLGHLKGQQIEVLSFVARRRESPLSITLVQGISKPDAMALTIQKGVELGVTQIIPLLCQRSRSNAGSILTPNRQRRLKRIATEAAEQSGRTQVPEVYSPLSWQQLDGYLPSGPRWLFWEEAEGEPGLRDMPDPGHEVTLLVGPEGGIEAQEVAFAKEMGFISLGLGPRILRTETAALTVITACQLLWGDMGGENK